MTLLSSSRTPGMSGTNEIEHPAFNFAVKGDAKRAAMSSKSTPDVAHRTLA